MFEAVRNNKRVAQVILALLIVPFAFFGMDAYFSDSGSANEAARVGGTTIGAWEFDQALREQQDRLRQDGGGQVDRALLQVVPLDQQLLLAEAGPRALHGRRGPRRELLGGERQTVAAVRPHRGAVAALEADRDLVALSGLQLQRHLLAVGAADHLPGAVDRAHVDRRHAARAPGRAGPAGQVATVVGHHGDPQHVRGQVLRVVLDLDGVAIGAEPIGLLDEPQEAGLGHRFVRFRRPLDRAHLALQVLAQRDRDDLVGLHQRGGLADHAGRADVGDDRVDVGILGAAHVDEIGLLAEPGARRHGHAPGEQRLGDRRHEADHTAARGRRGHPSSSLRFCAANSSGVSVPRCSMPSRRSSCSRRSEGHGLRPTTLKTCTPPAQFWVKS